ncbi:hypothetical protein [Aquabacterium sp.]|uniref:hypothetical protein n=1 Tax=Aquabacterium sp. TaxID=1872578 RepID=UPI002C5EA14E|nr:hypothetical protein [Aquabacterium sp.]HSW07461.1 hypothetical protein [Aquabacterium sp.]
MGKRCAYLPFPESDSASEYQELLDWALERTKARGVGFGWDKILFADSSDLGDNFRGLLDEDDVIYILGHCEAGGSKLSSNTGKSSVDVDSVVEDLLDKIDTGFRGKIKIYACDSAVSCWFYPAFTQQFANKMFGKGYRRARFFGYLKAVGTQYVPVPNQEGLHRAACKDDWIGQIKRFMNEEAGFETLGRAKDFRLEVHPQ